MDTHKRISSLDEDVINEIVRVGEQSSRASARRETLAVWASRIAFTMAMLVLGAGLVVGWFRRSDLEAANPTLLVIAGVGALLLVAALLAYMLSRSGQFLMAGKWGYLETQYRKGYPEEFKEAAAREHEVSVREERTAAREAIDRERSRAGQSDDR